MPLHEVPRYEVPLHEVPHYDVPQTDSAIANHTEAHSAHHHVAYGDDCHSILQTRPLFSEDDGRNLDYEPQERANHRNDDLSSQTAKHSTAVQPALHRHGNRQL